MSHITSKRSAEAIAHDQPEVMEMNAMSIEDDTDTVRRGRCGFAARKRAKSTSRGAEVDSSA